MKKIYLLLLTLLVSMTTVMAADYYIHRDENGWNVDTSKDKFEYLSSAVTIDNVEYHYKLTFNQYSSIPSGPFKISEGTGWDKSWGADNLALNTTLGLSDKDAPNMYFPSGLTTDYALYFSPTANKCILYNPNGGGGNVYSIACANLGNFDKSQAPDMTACNETIDGHTYTFKYAMTSDKGQWKIIENHEWTKNWGLESTWATNTMMQGGQDKGNFNAFTGTIYFDPAEGKVYAYTKPTVGNLTFSPESTILSGKSVTITCGTADATIYYTLDNSDPRTSANRQVYSASNKPVIDTDHKILKAYATMEGYNDSAVKSQTYTVRTLLGANDKIYLGGFGFQYTENGVSADWEKVNYPAMTWDPENKWYSVTIKPEKETIYYRFFTKNGTTITWYAPNNTSSVQNDKTAPSTWSTGFTSNESELKNENLTTSRLYRVFIRQNETGQFQYAIVRLPEVSETYTVYLDLSQMGFRKWNATDVKAIVSGNTINSTSIAGDVITFNFDASADTKIKFISETGTNAVEKSKDFELKNGKTYTLVYVTGSDDYSWNEKAVSEIEKTVNLPYGPDDFKEPKYFLVGTRMGNWHLQPEWELIKQDDGTYKVNGGRFVYRTNFGVAKVNSYANYVRHIYQLVTRANKSAGTLTADKVTNKVATIQDLGEVPADDFNTAYFDGEALNVTKANTKSVNDGGMAMTFAYNGAWNPENDENKTGTNRNLSTTDKGTWVDVITLKLNGKKDTDGNPLYNLSFQIPNDVVNIDERMFTLVGSDITHKGYLSGQYSPDGTDNKLKTLRGGEGWWQESWVQYDENGKPYYDYNGHFLYHTAFVPSIFDDTEVKFQLPDVNGKKFDYSSSAVTFVEASQLSDLANDPYRELYKELKGQKRFESGQTIKGGVATDGTDFEFKLGAIDKNYTADESDWKVFVIRDAWVKGEFKIWNGWSGNTTQYEYFGDNDGEGARWNYLNAGPYSEKLVTLTDDDIIDIHAGENGTAQVPDKLGVIKKGTDVNYKVENLTYFNRVILLYNTAQEDALNSSYILFIQDDTQPVIKGFANEDRTASYDWDLLNVKPNTDAKITGYTITRYTVTPDGNINPKVVKSETGLDWKVFGFQTKSGVEETPLNPGTYFYNLKVNYTNSEGEADVREANSNRFVIYGDVVAPKLRVEQLIVLTRAGYDAIMNTRKAENDEYSYTGLQTRFESAFKSTTTGKVRDYAPDSFYLTYNDGNLDADHYAIYINTTLDEDELNPDVRQMTEVNPTEVANFMKEPTYYKWAARFYVRALDKTAFDKEYSVQNIPVKNLSISLTDVAAAELSEAEYMQNENHESKWETNSRDIATSTYTVSKIAGGTRQYIGSIVDRDGFLGAGTMAAKMSYDYGDKHAETTDSVFFTPVVPLPYDLKATYVYRAGEFGNPVEEHLIKTFGTGNVSRDFAGHLQVETYSKAFADTQTEKYTVTLPENAVNDERHLDCVFEFTRPNVSEAILEHYNIQYTITVKSNYDETAPDYALQDFEKGDLFEKVGTYYDMSPIEFEPEYEADGVTVKVDEDGNPIYKLDENGNPKRWRDDNDDPIRTPYQIIVPNTHPSGAIWPSLNINGVVYERTNKYGGGDYRLGATYKYDDLNVYRKNTKSATTEAGAFSLGRNDFKGEDTHWYLMGHEEFTYENARPSTDVTIQEFPETQVFLIEMSNGNKVVAGKSLWWHDHANNVQGKNVDVEQYPFLPADVATEHADCWFEKKPFYLNQMDCGDATPSLTFTPIYLYIRDLSVDTEQTAGNVQYRDLVPVTPGEKPSEVKRRGVKRRAGEQTTPSATNTTGFSINPENEIMLQTTNGGEVKASEYNAADHGTITSATYDATQNHPELVVSPGTVTDKSTTANAPVVTGVENVSADAVNAEAEYYNLEGMRVEHPAKGQIYIEVRGTQVRKVLL